MKTHQVTFDVEILDPRFKHYRPVCPTQYRQLKKGEVGYDLRHQSVFDNRVFRDLSLRAYVVLEKVSGEPQGDPTANAAAPAMHEALREIIAICDSHGITDDDDPISLIWNIAEKAIDKSGGE